MVFDPGMLRQCRKRNGLKQAEVAMALSKSPSSVSTQENGDSLVAAEDLAAYADLYGVSVDRFFKETLS